MVELLVMIVVEILCLAVAWTWLIAMHARMSRAPEHWTQVNWNSGFRRPGSGPMEVSYARRFLFAMLRFCAPLIPMAMLLLAVHGELGAGLPALEQLIFPAALAAAPVLMQFLQLRRQIAGYSFRRLRMHAWSVLMTAAIACLSVFLTMPLATLVSNNPVAVTMTVLISLRLLAEWWGIYRCARVAAQDAEEDQAMAMAMARQ